MKNRTIRLFLILVVTVVALGPVRPRSAAMESNTQVRDSDVRADAGSIAPDLSMPTAGIQPTITLAPKHGYMGQEVVVSGQGVEPVMHDQLAGARPGLSAPLSGGPSSGWTALVSVDSGGTQGDGMSMSPSISANGRYVAFHSYADNLVAGDTNSHNDVFVHDWQTGETTRVSVASWDTQGDNGSYAPSISANARYVAFYSYADNLVAGDTNDCRDVFVRDRQTGETTRVSVASDGTQGDSASYDPSISANGRYVAFRSYATNLVEADTNGKCDIFVHDRQTGETTRVSVASWDTQGDDGSDDPSISADGRYVAFYSYATNLVAGDTNDCPDVFVHDRQTGDTARVSVSSWGVQGDGWSMDPSISADGRYVAFESCATNLVAGDTNGEEDVFVHDRQMEETTLVSVASDGAQGDRPSAYPSISALGRYVAFGSQATNLVAGDTNGVGDVFVHDRQTGETARVSVATDGTQGDAASYSSPSISALGRYVAFESEATNLVAGDTNGDEDVFLHGSWFKVYLPLAVKSFGF